MRVIVFDVQHGFCAFVKSPTGHGMLIDCGRGDAFSAVKYVIDHELPTCAPHDGKRLTALLISHPHDDHIADIERLVKLCPPSILHRQRYTWEEVKTPGS